MIAGFEVPHTHLHVVPIEHMGHLDFGLAEADPDPAGLDLVAEMLRTALRVARHPDVV